MQDRQRQAPSQPIARREFLRGAVAVGAAPCLGALLLPRASRASPVPRADPAAHLSLAWTKLLPWERAVDISKVEGRSWEERLERAQKELSAQGGGVVYFPAGTYEMRESIRLADGIILRGADPEGATSAHDAAYDPPAKLVFPRYEPKLSGDGAPIDKAFRGIYLESPERGSGCGVVNISLNRAHVHFAESPEHKLGSNRLVVGCVLRNAAVADERVPDGTIGQKPWQRFTKWHHPAVSVVAHENVLLANNRFVPSDDSFLMKGYAMKARRIAGRTSPVIEYDVLFDYDFRPGLASGGYCIGAPGGEEPSGTPETHPWGFRRGIVIRDNYVYSTGRNAILFAGDGVLCANNVIRIQKDVWRPTHTGRDESSGSSTTDTRAVQMRGWRWRVEGNDYEVWRNWCSDHKYHINDGEGLMHENHCNSHIVDSYLIGNRGNAYLSLYKTGGIDGLVVEDNDIRVDRGLAIFVEADHDKQRRGHCRNVTIARNTTAGGILIAGEPASGNVVRGNRNVGARAPLRNRAKARLEENEGYEVTEE
ncbi:MAG: hypothetical protein JXA90_07935 [Planctomycetes bacterium]|nr:hypothetical protein [Planctomycetota bacterium]